jgi:hypothetical protein
MWESGAISTAGETLTARDVVPMTSVAEPPEIVTDPCTCCAATEAGMATIAAQIQ